MRALTLEALNLSWTEYSSYTSLFHDFAEFSQRLPNSADTNGADYYEHVAVSMLEVRGWLRGQFSTLSSRQIDQVHLIRFTVHTLEVQI